MPGRDIDLGGAETFLPTQYNFFSHENDPSSSMDASVVGIPSSIL
jgi:hypothetical protein